MAKEAITKEILFKMYFHPQFRRIEQRRIW